MKNENRITCSVCLVETNHDELFAKQTMIKSQMISTDPPVDASEGYSYTVFQCCGCSNVVMRKDFWFTDLTPDTWDPSYRSWHPALATRKMPSWLQWRRDTTADLLKQIYAALNADLRTLAMMGIRALLDQLLNEKVGDIGGFAQKLKRACDLGFLSARQLEVIQPALEAGHAASHRAFEPTTEVLTFSLDVVEGILHQDELAKKVDAIKNATPKR
jgi:Domain of unknown function (DUF4145)